MILGFMWCVILRYQSTLMGGVSAGAGENGAGASAGAGAGTSAAELKRALLRWCNECLEPTGLSVNNFTNDWTDGRALLGILHTQTRGAVRGWEGSADRDVRENLEAGFAGAEALGVCRMLLVDDLARCHETHTAPDEHAVMTYVAEVHSALAGVTACGSPQEENPESDTQQGGTKEGQEGEEKEQEDAPMVIECENCKRLLEELARLQAQLGEAQEGLETLAGRAEAECGALQKANEELRRERDGVREAARQQQAEFAAVRDEMVQLSRDLAAKNEQLLRELGDARTENRALQEQVRNAQTAHDAERDAQAARDAELERLQRALADAEAAAAQELARLQREQREKCEQCRQAAQERDAAAAAEAAAKAAAAEAEAEAARAAQQELLREQGALRQRLGEQDAELQRLRRELEEARKQQQDNQTEAAKAAAAKAAAETQRKEALERECDELYEEAARLRHATAQLRAKQGRLTRTAEDLRAEIGRAQAAQAAAQEAAAARATAAQGAKEELRRAEAANRLLGAEVAELRNVLARHRAEEQIRADRRTQRQSTRGTATAAAPVVPRSQSMRAPSASPEPRHRAGNAMSPALARSVAATSARGRALLNSSPSKAAGPGPGRLSKSASTASVRTPEKSTSFSGFQSRRSGVASSTATERKQQTGTQDWRKTVAMTTKEKKEEKKRDKKKEEEEEDDDTKLVIPKRVHSADATVESLTAERERLREEVRTLREEHGKLDAACAELRVEIEGLRALLAGLARDASKEDKDTADEEAADELRAAQAEHARLVRERDALVAELARSGAGTLLHEIARDAEPDVARAEALLASGACAVDARDGRGATALLLACRNGHLALARVLVAHGADAAIADAAGDTSVHAAVARGGDVELVRTACAGARGDVAASARNVRGDTPVALAAARNDTAVALELLAHDADCTSADHTGTTPLGHAAAHANVQLVEALLKQGCDGDECETQKEDGDSNKKDGKDKNKNKNKKRVDVNAADGDGNTPLHLLMRSGDGETGTGAGEGASAEAGMKVLELLVGAGADVNARNRDRVSPLQMAVLARNERLVRGVAESARVEIDACNRQGETALYTAAWLGLDAVVRELCARGADPGRANNDGWRPLHAACSKGHASTAAVLLASGADADALSREGHTAAFYASSAGSLAAVRVLAARGADLARAAPGAWQPVHIAAYKKDEALLRYLLADARVDPNPVCARNKGYTPLHMCVMSPAPAPAVLELLLAHGADVNAQSTLSRNTPMHLAALMGHVAVAERLLRAPAIDLARRNREGKTALELACSYSRPIVLLLCRHLGIQRIPPVHEQVRRTATTRAPGAPPRPRDVEDASRRASALARQKEEQQKQQRLQEILQKEQRERDHSDRA